MIDFTKKKIIIADVDDTICESCQQISEQMAQQISMMIKSGFSFAFISGTKAEDLQRMISSKLRETHHLLGTTGTKYVKVQQDIGEVKYNLSLTTLEKEEIISTIKELVQRYNVVPITSTEDQIQDRDSQITLSAIGRHAPSELKAKYDADGSRRKVWVEFLKQKMGEDRYEFKIGGTTSVDVTRKGLDKEWGIREFLKFNNLSTEEVLFFGDKLDPGGNDYPATKVVDCIAVTSPEDTLKKLKEISDFRL